MNSLQAPIGSGFGATSTGDAVIAGIDLSAKTAIVTGGYSGLGLETVRVLAAAGAQVVVPSRAPERAQEAVRGIRGVEVVHLDLTDAGSIGAFAEHFLRSGRSLEILVNSAGIMASPLSRDARGNESQLSTNHLGHFLLTKALWPALRRARGARVVAVSSRGHQIAPVDFEDINFERRAYEKWVAYGQSKSANALFAVGVDARGEADGIRAFSLHPGTVLGPLAKHLTAEEIAAFGVHDDQGRVIVDPTRDLKSVAQGAATAVWCATSPRLDSVGGVYCEDCDIAKITAAESKERSGVRPWAVDRDLAERLWSLSETLTEDPA